MWAAREQKRLLVTGAVPKFGYIRLRRCTDLREHELVWLALIHSHEVPLPRSDCNPQPNILHSSQSRVRAGTAGLSRGRIHVHAQQTTTYTGGCTRQ